MAYEPDHFAKCTYQQNRLSLPAQEYPLQILQTVLDRDPFRYHAVKGTIIAMNLGMPQGTSTRRDDDVKSVVILRDGYYRQG